MLGERFFVPKELEFTKDHNNILFKDALDVDAEFKQAFPKASFISTRQKYTEHPHKIKILSVQFSKVGRNTLAQFPNLQWVQTRSHATHNINMQECKKHGVRVITAHPFTEPCARWLVDMVRGLVGSTEPYGFLGWGSIAKKAATLLAPTKEVYTWQTTTKASDKKTFLQNTKTCIVSIPLTNKTKGWVSNKFLASFAQPYLNVVGLSPMGVFSLAQNSNRVILDEKHIAWKYPPTNQTHYVAVIKEQIEYMKGIQ